MHGIMNENEPVCFGNTGRNQNIPSLAALDLLLLPWCGEGEECIACEEVSPNLPVVDSLGSNA